MPNYCGEKAYAIEYPDDPVMAEDFLIDFDPALGYLVTNYTNKDSVILGENKATLVVSYIDWPLADKLKFDITFTVECPDFHTTITPPFNNTLVGTPTIMYDMTAPLTFPMNYWNMDPWDDQEDIVCFQVTQHTFVEIATGLPVNYLSSV